MASIATGETLDTPRDADAPLGPLHSVARLTAPDFYAGDPYPAYRRLRREAPVYWYQPGEFWALSKYDDIRSVLRNPDCFSSAYGLTVGKSIPFDDGSETPGWMPRRAELRQREQLGTFGAGTESLLASDPPRHGALRRLVNYGFTPKAVAAFESEIRNAVLHSLDAIDPSQPTDLVEALAVPVPLRVIAKILGAPAEDWELFRRWSDSVAAVADLDYTGEGQSADAMASHMQQMGELAQYFLAAFAERRTSPREDLLTALAHAEIDGEPIGDANQLVMVINVLVAGNETTRSLIADGAKLLGEHRDQRELLVKEPQRTTAAVEEILRYANPIVGFARTATEGTEIRGQGIERGDYLWLLFSAANRDEDVWRNPDRFDVTREPDPGHIAFGFGEHFCLGAALARLEARIVFEELLRRFPHYELAGEVKRIPSTVTPGICSLAVLLEP